MTVMDAVLLDVVREADEGLVDEQTWIDVEFLAIMAASGIRTELIVQTEDRDDVPPASSPATSLRRAPRGTAGARTPSRARVRSPPTRP